jgi:signal transduction histidine kinase
MGQVNEIEDKLAITTEALRKCEERALAGQFALEVMHEVRNPLDALGNLLKLAEEEDDVAMIRSYLSQANEQVATVHQIADQTLSLARAPAIAREVDLAHLAEAALRIHHRRIQSQSIHLVRDFSDGVIADVYTGQILQVVSNLLANALDAMPNGGSMSFKLRKRGARVQVLVADSGHGMKREHLKRIFEPFFTTKQDRGTGLGLALSKKIIERHNGTITARSSVNPKRSGTTFSIILPRKFVETTAVK